MSDMKLANKLELHYYLANKSHQIDAFIRNQCEAEILAIIRETSIALDLYPEIIAEATKEGGFREFWKLLNENAAGISLILVVVQILLTLPAVISEFSDEDLEETLHHLQIEEAKLNIKKLKKELEDNPDDIRLSEKAVKHLSNNLKIIKRKSNLYSTLSKHNRIKGLGLSLLHESSIVEEETFIPKEKFGDFILTSNKLKPIEVEAEIEIISPVLKEGNYKWKGIYNEQPISFEMLDQEFKDSVILENIPFQHGSVITGVLRIKRELDESGNIKKTGYAVTTVISKFDGTSSIETLKGKKHLHTKKLKDTQGDLFST